MWNKAKITEIKKENNRLDLVVEFKNDTKTFTREFSDVTDLNNFKSQITNELDRLNKINDLALSLTIGDIDLTPVIVPPPTQDEQDKSNFDLLVMKRNYLENQIKVGAIKADDKLITDLEAEIKATFKPEFIGLSIAA